MRLPWPLTGRAMELRGIAAVIADPDPAGIIVYGPAGVGKSRVVREALTAASYEGCVVHWVVGTTAGKNLPLGALYSWAVPAAGESPQSVRSMVDALTAAPEGARVVVGVDDGHLLDDLSTFVLQQIVQRGAAKIVLTAREGEPIPAATQELWAEASFERLDLQPLSQDETTALVSAALGGPLEPDGARRLWNLTRGNPLYLRNIVEQEVSDGRLAQRHGYWRWSGAPVVAPSLAELIESRIGTLPDAVGDVVDALAVGEPIELASLTRIADAAAIEDADVRGLITLDEVDGRAEVRLAHPLYGELRRARAAATRLRRLRGRVAVELAASDERDEVRTVVRRALLSVDSDLEPDPELLLRAAEGAMFSADAPVADRLAAAAIRAGAGVQAYYIRAFALAWQGRGEDADAMVAATPTEGLTEADRVYLLGHRGFNRLWGLADPDGAKRLFDEASRIATPSTRSWCDAYMTVYWASMAQPQKALRFGDGVDLAQLPGVVSSAAAWALVVAHGDAGQAAEADRIAELGYASVQRMGTAAHMELLIVDRHVGALLQAGRMAEAKSLADRVRDQTLDVPGVARLLGIAIAGRVALGSGRLDDARTLLEAVVELFAGDSNGFRYRYLVPLTTALAMCGLTDDAATALRAVDAEHHRGYGFVGYERDLARAWAAACLGAVSEAIEIATSAAEATRANGQFGAEVVCLQTVAQFGDGSPASRLRELERIVQGPRAGVAARFAAALHAGEGSELAAVSEQFEQIGDLVAAVDAAAYASIMYRRRDLRGSALQCSVRGDLLAERCGGANTPALRQARVRLPLTDREREVAIMLGQGLSGHAIAQRLGLSDRTVEGYIYRAMAKTGATSRDELAALLRP